MAAVAALAMRVPAFNLVNLQLLHTVRSHPPLVSRMSTSCQSKGQAERLSDVDFVIDSAILTTAKKDFFLMSCV